MGYYLNPPERTQEIGRQVFGRSFVDFTEQLKPNECLVALGDRIMFQFAGLCFDGREFENFYSQNNSLASLGFYAVPKTAFPEYFADGEYTPQNPIEELVNMLESKGKTVKVEPEIDWNASYHREYDDPTFPIG